MTNRQAVQTTLQAASWAAIIAFIAVIVQALAAFSLPSGVLTQPNAPLPANVFLRAANEFPDITLIFFGADTLFVFGYILVFAGLYALTAPEAHPFAAVGMGAGVITALMDSAENGLFILYALSAKNGLPVAAPDIPLILVLAHLKWAGAFAALLAFGLVYPAREQLGMVIRLLMLVFPLVGVLGIMQPDLVIVRGLFFLVGMPLFAVAFWRESRLQERQG